MITVEQLYNTTRRQLMGVEKFPSMDVFKDFLSTYHMAILTMPDGFQARGLYIGEDVIMFSCFTNINDFHGFKDGKWVLEDDSFPPYRYMLQPMRAMYHEYMSTYSEE